MVFDIVFSAFRISFWRILDLNVEAKLTILVEEIFGVGLSEPSQDGCGPKNGVLEASRLFKIFGRSRVLRSTCVMAEPDLSHHDCVHILVLILRWNCVRMGA